MPDAWWSIMERGGPVMWPLLGLSVVSLTLSLERLWWFLSMGRSSAWSAARRSAAALREGKAAGARGHADKAGPLFGAFLRDVIEASDDRSDARLAENVETRRAAVERFLPTLSMIITASPMLGILGTVLGIIDSFEVLGGMGVSSGAGGVGGGVDPREVGAGIAEALITTAAGLVVALLTLVPYVWLRGRSETALGRLDALAMSVLPRDTAREAEPGS